MEKIDSRLIREHAAATRAAIETNLYARYRNVEVYELVQDNFTLYGQLVTLDALKPTKPLYNYKRLVFKYYMEMS